MWPLALLVTGFRQDLKALFVMNFLTIVLIEFSALSAINRNDYLEWIEFSDKLFCKHSLQWFLW